MQISLSAAVAFLACAGLSASTPIADKRDVTPPARYKLQTKVVGDLNDTGTDKNGLWLFSYHTGAGLGAGGLSPNESWAWEGYLNGSQQLFVANTDSPPWPLQVSYGAYQAWTPTTIGIDNNYNDYEGFYFNSTGLQYNQSTAGWLACDWSLTTPQLFSITQYYTNISFNAGCSKVELYPIAV